MRHFLTLPCHHMARHKEECVLAAGTGKGSGVRPISLQQVLRASRFAVCLKSQALARSALENARTMLTWYIHALDDSVMLPSRATLQRARARLDVTAMLLNRWEFARETRQIFALSRIRCISATRNRALRHSGARAVSGCMWEYSASAGAASSFGHDWSRTCQSI
jgi:hypothetical protein